MAEHANAEKLARIYVKIRDKRREVDKQSLQLKEQQDIVAAELLKVCNEQGATSIRTEAGTISKRTTKVYWSRDWEALEQFVIENNLLSLLQRRISTSNMEQFLQENPDVVPPGLNIDTTQTITILKR